MSRLTAYLIVALSVAAFAWLGSGTAAAAERWGPYPARVVEIVDGDTFRAMIKTFPGEFILRDVRLARANTPETNGQCEAEREIAARAESRLAQLIGQADAAVAVIVHDIDSFGRPLARVLAGDRDVGQILLDEGLAREYADGQWRDGFWCPALKSQNKGE